jgi:hypothetical protein
MAVTYEQTEQARRAMLKAYSDVRDYMDHPSDSLGDKGTFALLFAVWASSHTRVPGIVT